MLSRNRYTQLKRYTYAYPYVVSILNIVVVMMAPVYPRIYTNPFLWMYLISAVFVVAAQDLFGGCKSAKFLVFNPLIYPVGVSIFPALHTDVFQTIIVLETIVIMFISSLRFLAGGKKL